jgi:hypothetical protein
MQISFFEEFPTKKDLSKIKYVTFPTKLYIAARSLEEFNSIKIPSDNVTEIIYWPLLKGREGYWFSAFASREGMQRIFNELKGTNTPVMIDGELPTTHNSLLYITQLFNFYDNRKMLRNFVKKRKNIYIAEYFPSSKKAEKIMNFLGLSFRFKNVYPIKMVYSSMHDFGEKRIRQTIRNVKERAGKKTRIGLGTLTHGILGFEPIISLKLLERDLKICQEEGIEEVILFRLGGMNKEYQKLLEKYSS